MAAAPLRAEELASWEKMLRGEEEGEALRNDWRGPATRDGVEVEMLYSGSRKKVYATAKSTCAVHYTGRLAGSGLVFDGSRTKAERKPFQFRAGSGAVARGFEDGCRRTPLGGASRVRVPAALAYGKDGIDRLIPKNADLVFDVIVVAVDGREADAEDLRRANDASLRYLQQQRGGLRAVVEPFAEAPPEVRSFVTLRKRRVMPLRVKSNSSETTGSSSSFDDASEREAEEDAWLAAMGGSSSPRRVPRVAAPSSSREESHLRKRWLGTNAVGPDGLCALPAWAHLGPGWRALEKQWTWAALTKSQWARGVVMQAKQRAPIRHDEALRHVAVVETSIAAFAEYAHTDFRDDEARFYLNGWDFLSEKHRVFGEEPALDVPFVEDLSHELLLQFERETRAVLLGKNKGFEKEAAATAQRSSEALTKAFFAPPGAVTRLHRDNHGAHARLTVLRGTKLYVAFAPDDGRFLYVDDADHSPVDVLAPDLDAFPLYARATPYAAVLGPGDTLLVPKHWWHFAVSLTPSLTVMRNFWSSTNLPDLAALSKNNFQTKLRLLKDAGLLRSPASPRTPA